MPLSWSPAAAPRRRYSGTTVYPAVPGSSSSGADWPHRRRSYTRRDTVPTPATQSSSATIMEHRQIGVASVAEPPIVGGSLQSQTITSHTHSSTPPIVATPLLDASELGASYDSRRRVLWTGTQSSGPIYLECRSSGSSVGTCCSLQGGTALPQPSLLATGAIAAQPRPSALVAAPARRNSTHVTGLMSRTTLSDTRPVDTPTSSVIVFRGNPRGDNATSMQAPSVSFFERIRNSWLHSEQVQRPAGPSSESMVSSVPRSTPSTVYSLPTNSRPPPLARSTLADSMDRSRETRFRTSMLTDPTAASRNPARNPVERMAAIGSEERRPAEEQDCYGSYSCFQPVNLNPTFVRGMAEGSSSQGVVIRLQRQSHPLALPAAVPPYHRDGSMPSGPATLSEPYRFHGDARNFISTYHWATEAPAPPVPRSYVIVSRPGHAGLSELVDSAHNGARLYSGRAVPRAVPAAIINLLPSETFNGSFSANGHLSEGIRTCLVCHLDYDENEELRRLPCLHRFHCMCIDRWFETHATCPVCRTPVLEALHLSQLHSSPVQYFPGEEEEIPPDAAQTATSPRETITNPTNIAPPIETNSPLPDLRNPVGGPTPDACHNVQLLDSCPTTEPSGPTDQVPTDQGSTSDSATEPTGSNTLLADTSCGAESGERENSLEVRNADQLVPTGIHEIAVVEARPALAVVEARPALPVDAAATLPCSRMPREEVLQVPRSQDSPEPACQRPTTNATRGELLATTNNSAVTSSNESFGSRIYQGGSRNSRRPGEVACAIGVIVGGSRTTRGASQTSSANDRTTRTAQLTFPNGELLPPNRRARPLEQIPQPHGAGGRIARVMKRAREFWAGRPATAGSTATGFWSPGTSRISRCNCRTSSCSASVRKSQTIVGYSEESIGSRTATENDLDDRNMLRRAPGERVQGEGENRSNVAPSVARRQAVAALLPSSPLSDADVVASSLSGHATPISSEAVHRRRLPLREVITRGGVKPSATERLSPTERRNCSAEKPSVSTSSSTSAQESPVVSRFSGEASSPERSMGSSSSCDCSPTFRVAYRIAREVNASARSAQADSLAGEETPEENQVSRELERPSSRWLQQQIENMLSSLLTRLQEQGAKWRGQTAPREPSREPCNSGSCEQVSSIARP